MAHFIKRPRPDRQSYSLIGPDGLTIYDERIDQVNRDLKAGFPLDALEARMQAIRDSFKRTFPLDEENLRLAKARLEEKLGEKILARPDVAEQRLRKAVAVMGKVRAIDASKSDVLRAVSTIPARSRYQTVVGINELLKQARREFRIPNKLPPRPPEIAYITIEDWLKKAPSLPEPISTYLGALFATGARLGELPMARFDLTKGREKVTIEWQLRRGTRGEGPTKNNRVRTAPIIPPLIPFITRLNALGRAALCQLRLEEENTMRKAFKALCGLRIHDLRHSYAVAQAIKGASVQELADYIGDTVEVCRRHYRHYLKTDEEIQRAHTRWA